MYALYSILEYCEEPNMCRRKMQLSFLGEQFDSSQCGRMCDNCKNGQRVVQKQMKQESATILSFVEKAMCKITAKQTIDIMRGIKGKNHIAPDIVE